MQLILALWLNLTLIDKFCILKIYVKLILRICAQEEGILSLICTFKYLICLLESWINSIFIQCLENRVHVLENQNKALIEELHKLKRTYDDSGARVQGSEKLLKLTICAWDFNFLVCSWYCINIFIMFRQLLNTQSFPIYNILLH